MSVPLWGWLATLVGIGALVAVDIRQTRRPHEVGFREALTWSLAYIGAALVFAAALGAFAGAGPATGFITGYLVEKSLSVDNLFVFAVILAQFAVPARHQQRVLLIGVIGALLLRAVFIGAGAAAVQRFTVTFVVFGAFLLYTAAHLVRARGTSPDVADTLPVRVLRKVMPVSTDYRDDGLLTRVNGRRAATPLLVVVVTIFSVDIMFALDSIPAIFGITDSAYLVFTANAFALLGLRALYFLLVGLLDRLVHLHYGLAVVLGFIGVKLILHYVHSVNGSVPEIPTVVSLAVVLVVLTVATLTSLRATRTSRPRSPPPQPAAPVRKDRNAAMTRRGQRAPRGE